MGKVKRSLFRTFINTLPSGVADYALLGQGVTDLSISYNPDTLEETYIHQDSATIEVQAYAPEISLEMSIDSEDEAFIFLDVMRKDRAVLGDALTDIVNVWMYETPTLDEYPAEKQEVSVSFEDFGGEGGQTNKLSVTLSFVGEAVKGMFDVVALTFTPD